MGILLRFEDGRSPCDGLFCLYCFSASLQCDKFLSDALPVADFLIWIVAGVVEMMREEVDSSLDA